MISADLNKLSNFLSKEEYGELYSFIKIYTDKKIGVWHNIKDDKFKVIILNQYNYDVGIFESHKKYIDIHIVLKGVDCVFLAEDNEVESIREYDENLDYSLIKSKIKEEIIIEENKYCILYPGEFHSNRFKDPKTIKIVVKKIFNEKSSSLYNS
jgi:biofilm protein TabA